MCMYAVVRWHAVKDELPVNGGHFLVVAGGIVQEAEYLPNSQKWVDPVECYQYYDGVIYWAEMPLQPRREKEIYNEKDSD